jgi:oxygen-independent coproporphyrinogen III oxidase
VAARDLPEVCRLDGDDFLLMDDGRPFARSVAAVFDAYLANGKGRHSLAV